MTSTSSKAGVSPVHMHGGVWRGTKMKWKKGRGDFILFFFKIHIGLNKLRGSAQGILDLGFETERTPLLLAIWLL